MPRSQLITLIGLVFGTVSFLAILGGVGWSMISNTEANQETLERVRIISEEGPRAIQTMLTETNHRLERVEDKMEDLHLEIVRQCRSVGAYE